MRVRFSLALPNFVMTIKKLIIKRPILLISTIIISVYFLISSIIKNDSFHNLKSLLNVEQKDLIKKYIFPYKIISQQQKKISQLQKNLKSNDWLAIELQKKKEGSEIITEENIIKL